MKVILDLSKSLGSLFFRQYIEDEIKLNNSVISSPCYNPNQKMTYDSLSNTITYEGERHPFLQDGKFHTICNLYGCKWPYKYDDCVKAVKDIPVIDYETSDNRLYWYETLIDYIERRASSQDVIQYVKNNTDRFKDLSSCEILFNNPNMKEVSIVFNLLQNHISAIKINAAFDKETIKQATMLYNISKV